MNRVSATLDTETPETVIPPVPDYAPTVVPVKPSKDPVKVRARLSEKIRISREKLTERLREKADEWREEADSAEPAPAPKTPAAPGEAAPAATDGEPLSKEDAPEDKESRYARLLEKLVERSLGSSEEREVRRGSVRQFKRARGFNRRGLVRVLFMTGVSWTFSGGFLIAAYDRFIVATDIAKKMPGMPRAEYLTAGAPAHTWDLFTGIPYQMRETLQLYMEAGSTTGFLATLFLLALPVAAAEHWRTLIHTRWLMWALRLPLVGYLTGFATFLLELGPGGTL